MSVSELELHEGPWTEAEFLALPESRVELLDGELLVSPSASGRHQRISFRLCLALELVRPDSMAVFEAINVRLATGRILIPDLAVVTTLSDDFTVLDAAEVAMAVEIVSPGSVGTDRAVKPRLYAEAGIPHYVRIELAGPTAVAGRLDGDRYTFGAPGPVLRLAEPFPVEIDLPALLSAERPLLG